jgi:hypothetical protein
MELAKLLEHNAQASALTLRLQLGAVLAPMLALSSLVCQLWVLRPQVDRQQLFGPEPGLAPTVEVWGRAPTSRLPSTP